MEKNYPHLEENFTHTYVSPRSHPCKQHCALACLKGCISTLPKQTILGFARNLMKGKPVFYEISTVAVSFLKASSSIFSFVNWLTTNATNFSSSLMAETNKSYKGPFTALHVEQKLIKGLKFCKSSVNVVGALYSSPFMIKTPIGSLKELKPTLSYSWLHWLSNLV